MTATTSKIWISPPTLNTKAPRIHPMTRITANTYNKSVITFWFVEAFVSKSNANRSAVLNSCPRHARFYWWGIFYLPLMNSSSIQTFPLLYGRLQLALALVFLRHYRLLNMKYEYSKDCCCPDLLLRTVRFRFVFANAFDLPKN
jgi:hypothetical protein